MSGQRFQLLKAPIAREAACIANQPSRRCVVRMLIFLRVWGKHKRG